jgi:hypothetical protein
VVNVKVFLDVDIVDPQIVVKSLLTMKIFLSSFSKSFGGVSLGLIPLSKGNSKKIHSHHSQP